jgi:hypothetical protein
VNVVQEVEQFEDFGYYIDADGYKKFGVIPKAQKLPINFN